MTNPVDIIEALGLRPFADTASFEPLVVFATVVAATSDVALLKVRSVDGPDYDAIMPVTEWASSRHWEVGASYQLLQLGAGPRPVLSAVRPELVEALLMGVSPEVRAGTVRVMGVARAAGVRTKVAVAATEAGVDPIASCVGRQANRVRYLTTALGGERIDVVSWDADDETFLRNALAPASVGTIVIDGHNATASAPAHQMSAAVGAAGLNSALAGQLVGLQVTIVQG